MAVHCKYREISQSQGDKIFSACIRKAKHMKNRISRTHGTRLNLENARRGEDSSDDTRERERSWTVIRTEG
jgi:hypothetical protein